MQTQRPNSPKLNVAAAASLGDLLSRNTLKIILFKARQLIEINHVIAQAVGGELGAHIHTADISQSCLVIQADSAAWGMRLRFQEADILAQLRRQPCYAALREIRVKVRPWYTGPERKYWEKPVLSASSAAIIADTATYITDEKLKKSLLRLAARCVNEV